MCKMTQGAMMLPYLMALATVGFADERADAGLLRRSNGIGRLRQKAIPMANIA